MTTARTAAAAAPAVEPECIAWDDFVREIPDRSVARVIAQRDAIEDEAGVCARTQSWSPRSIRSGWASELFDVVRAVDALREAHDAVGEAEDEDEHERLVLARCEAFAALEDAVEAAEDEARRLAGVVAEAEAEEGVEALLLAADAAATDDDWQSSLAEYLDRVGDGDRGWTVTREGDTLVVTGWAMQRHVMGDDCGGLVLGTDLDAVEAECRGRFAFQVTRDSDGSDEPNGLCATVAEAVEAVESLAAAHGVAYWDEAWGIKPRGVPQTKAELVDEIMARLGAK